MDKSDFIGSVREGEEFVGFYALKRCELKEYDGGSRLDVELSDKSGSVPGVIWDNIQETRDLLKKASVVKVKGRLQSYKDTPQAKIERIRPAEVGEYNPDSFLPWSSADLDALKTKVKWYIESLKDTYLSKLAGLIFNNAGFMEEFSRTPGGMKWHHPYLGGLLEHSVGVTDICEFMAGNHPEINRDLLILGALLHDVGKIKELSSNLTIDYTDEGRLEGHIMIGYRMVRSMCERIEEFPPKLKMLLCHLILSHQGQKEFSSPVEPMIPEGFVLYYADEMDAKLNAVNRIVENTGKDGASWSEYIRLLGRYIYTDRDL